MTIEFGVALAGAARLTQGRLAAEMARLPQVAVVEAMGYAVRGGKGLRGFLVLESAALHGVEAARTLAPAAAIEALHAYSLIHDDLPCMDNDDLRRGQPTVHRKWDEATAILAGDALQTLAFQLCVAPEIGPADVRVALLASMVKAAGAEGMVLGQALDIAAETADKPLDLQQITTLQAAKTGALIGWSAEAGALLAGADPGPLRRYAAALGLAFQIADDILDIEGDSAAVGKALRKDASAGKATFASLLGVGPAKARAQSLVDEACDALQPFGEKAETLRAAARFVITRRN